MEEHFVNDNNKRNCLLDILTLFLRQFFFLGLYVKNI